jgi:TnpA family transposase
MFRIIIWRSGKWRFFGVIKSSMFIVNVVSQEKERKRKKKKKENVKQKLDT